MSPKQHSFVPEKLIEIMNNNCVLFIHFLKLSILNEFNLTEHNCVKF